MYYFGRGAPKDYAEAVKWWRKPADQGNAGAQYFLGLMYDYGEGVPVDLVMAYKWMNLARSAGYEDAVETLDRLSNEMTREQIAEAQKVSREWYEAHQAKE